MLQQQAQQQSGVQRCHVLRGFQFPADEQIHPDAVVDLPRPFAFAMRSAGKVGFVAHDTPLATGAPRIYAPPRTALLQLQELLGAHPELLLQLQAARAQLATAADGAKGKG